MDAFRFEQRTGELLIRTGHQQKLLVRRPQLHEVFRDPKVSQSDRTLARELLTDLQKALSGQ